MKKVLVAAVGMIVAVLLLGLVLFWVISANMWLPVDDDGITNSERRAMKHSCDGDRATLTLRFARQTGRVVPYNDKVASPDPEGCFVMVAMPKRLGVDPTEAIDDAVGPLGWERKGGATWLNGEGRATWANKEGFAVSARIFDEGPSMAAYEVRLKGRTAD